MITHSPLRKTKSASVYCVIVQWQDGRRECVTDKDQAEQWIWLEAPDWLLDAQKKAK
jgi:hypothetical protein